MRPLMKLIFILFLAALFIEFCRYIYKIGTEPEPHRSVNPYSAYGKMFNLFPSSPHLSSDTTFF